MSRTLLALVILAAGGAALVFGSAKPTPTGSGAYDYTAAIAPLRAAAVAKYKQSFNLDPNTAIDPAAATIAGNAVVSQIQTSWNNVELQALADSLAVRGTTLTANAQPAAGQAYTDAAAAIQSVAMAVKARNQAIGTPIAPAVAGGLAGHGRVHSPLAPSARRVQLHMTRGR